ncbi:MAG: gyrase subunit A protein [candidate division CPR1 bacterium GW2011_GWA2_42_17]|uniref:DNA topoisomerase (ATP-hydrolyzing) n=1 Tax=candidate division CPR1 bacterium GW2011_GWA2_42_17 TaxID=1618341 RepID=A0A0G1BVI2_9BACT|nr:MAG: gyrase subunit A protein [candidate division CPR1 bacterium GW2011_GWA2_42_17]
MMALVDNEPKTLTLKIALLEYLKHRKNVIIRRTLFDLKKAYERGHILEGLKIALDNLDQVIETIKKSKDAETAKANLMAKFKLTEMQATAILDMQLRRLAALERQKILDELKAIKETIKRLETLLTSPTSLMLLIKNELLAIKEKYADPRRTKVTKNRPGEFSEEELIVEEKVIITLSKSGYIKRLPLDTYRRQGRGGKGVTGASLKEEDVVIHLLTASTHDIIYFFTNLGRVFSTRVYELPETSRQARGQAVVNIIGLGGNEKVANVLTITNHSE